MDMKELCPRCSQEGKGAKRGHICICKALTEARAAGLAEGEAERKELDRSLLEQHQASMITLGDSDLLAVGSRLLDRAEEAEAKLAALTAEAGRMREALEEVRSWLPTLTDGAFKKWREAHQGKPCTSEMLYAMVEKALSPEPEKPAPDGAVMGPDGIGCATGAGAKPAPDDAGRKEEGE